MKEIVNLKIPFIKKIMSLDEAREVFRKIGRMDRFRSIEYRKSPM